MISTKRLGCGLAIAALLGVAACVNSDEPGAQDSTQGKAESGYPVTIEQRFGSTTIEQRPTHVVAVEEAFIDTAIELDADLVAYAAPEEFFAGLEYPWRGGTEAVEDDAMVNTGGELNIAQIASHNPDLILAGRLAADQKVYDLLSELAPTIGVIGEEGQPADSWQLVTETVGQALGEADAAGQLIAETENKVASVARQLPELEGKTYSAAFFDAGAISVILGGDETSKLYEAWGLELAPGVTGLEEAAPGRAQLSMEQIGRLDGDLLFYTATDPDGIKSNPLFQQLPAVQENLVQEQDLVLTRAAILPSAPSVQYTVDAYLPVLRSAVAE